MRCASAVTSNFVLLLLLITCKPGIVIDGEVDGGADGDSDGDGDGDGDLDCENGCDDGVDCTLDECFYELCYHTPQDEACDGGRCDEVRGCVECFEDGECDDMVACTIDRCEAKVCTHEADSSLCNGGLDCDPLTGCMGCTLNTDCDDSVDCTEDICSESICSNVPNDDLCPDVNSHCIQTLGCVECQSSVECSDDVICNGEETCTDGVCHPGSAIDCDDGVPCTYDMCSESGGGRCTNTPDDTLCSLGETCDPGRGCVAVLTFYAHTSSRLFVIDLAPPIPTVSRIGDFGVTMTDIAEAADGTLYGIGFRDFYTINTRTGAATLVGSLRVSEDINSLTVAPDGTLYAGSNPESGGTLYRVNPVTGVATAVGGFGANISSSGDIVWGPYGAIYAPDPAGMVGEIDQIVSINPATGAASPLFDTPYENIYGLTYTGGDLIGLCEGGELVRIDVDTNTTSLIADLDHIWWGAS